MTGGVAGAGGAGRLAGSRSRPITVFVGTQQNAADGGIHAVCFDERTGRFGSPSLAANVDRPTFLLSDRRRQHLYAASEVGNAGDRPGAVLGFAIEPGGQAIHRLGAVSSGGGGATHLAFDRRGRSLFAANFGGGSAALFPLGVDGSPGPAAAVAATSGTGPHRRQTAPHPHGVTIDPSGRFLLVPDMGADRVFVFGFDGAAGRLTPHAGAFFQLRPGFGPRSLVFGRGGRFAYLLGELSAKIAVLGWDRREGQFSLLGTVAMDAPGSDHPPSAAALTMSAGKRCLYVSNRGTGEIQSFCADGRTGRLEARQRIAAGGAKPWAAELTPGGRWLLIANQGSDAVVAFRVGRGGDLVASAARITIPTPTSIAFGPRRSVVAPGAEQEQDR